MVKNGAGNQVRTGDLNLGKVALYQLSYSRTDLPIVGLLSAPVKALRILVPPKQFVRWISIAHATSWQRLGNVQSKLVEVSLEELNAACM